MGNDDGYIPVQAEFSFVIRADYLAEAIEVRRYVSMLKDLYKSIYGITPSLDRERNLRWAAAPAEMGNPP